MNTEKIEPTNSTDNADNADNAVKNERTDNADSPNTMTMSIMSPPRFLNYKKKGWLVTALLLAQVVIVTSGLLIYHQFGRTNQKVGVVDLQSVIQYSELYFTELVTRPGSSRADYEPLVKETGEKIQLALEEVANECDCILLTKAAVIHGAENYTRAVQNKLGINDKSIDELTKKIQRRIAVGEEKVTKEASPGDQ